MNTVLTETLSAGELPVGASHKEHTGIVESLYRTAARLDRFGFAMLRLGLVVVLCFLGGLKTANAIPAAAQTTTAPVPTGSAELEQMSDLQPFTHIAYVPANADLSTIRIDTVKMVKVATKLRSMSNTRDCDDWPGNTADCIRTRYESRVPA